MRADVHPAQADEHDEDDQGDPPAPAQHRPGHHGERREGGGVYREALISIEGDRAGFRPLNPEEEPL